MDYKKMLIEARKANKARVNAMVRNGKTVDEAKAALKAKADRNFAIASARAKCGITSRPSTIGEILAAKAR